MKPRMPAIMIERLEYIARRLDALTDSNDAACAIPASAKDACRPYVDSWIKPDVKALLEWARGDCTANEANRWFPTHAPPPPEFKG